MRGERFSRRACDVHDHCFVLCCFHGIIDIDMIEAKQTARDAGVNADGRHPSGGHEVGAAQQLPPACFPSTRPLQPHL